MIQHHLAGALDAPIWLVEGEATYAQTLYSSGGRISDADRHELVRKAADTGPLRQYFTRGEHPGNFYPLGALAVDWLTEHAGAAAIVQFWRELASADTWRAAFEAAFGLTPDAFYARFEAYRAELLHARLPHLDDDVAEPIVTTSGDVPDSIVAMVHTEIERLQSFYRDRFEAGAADYTLHLADAETYQVAAQERARYVHSCRSQSLLAPAYVVVLDASCDTMNLAYLLASTHRSLLEPTVYTGTMPHWLQSGINSYTSHHYAQVSSVAIPSGNVPRARALRSARGSVALRELATLDGTVAHSAAAAGLPLLAVEWLAEHAGEPALFVYWREYASDRSDWRRAFETAFGLTPDAFHAKFERYRATLDS